MRRGEDTERGGHETRIDKERRRGRLGEEMGKGKERKSGEETRQGKQERTQRGGDETRLDKEKGEEGRTGHRERRA